MHLCMLLRRLLSRQAEPQFLLRSSTTSCELGVDLLQPSDDCSARSCSSLTFGMCRGRLIAQGCFGAELQALQLQIPRVKIRREVSNLREVGCVSKPAAQLAVCMGLVAHGAQICCDRSAARTRLRSDT